MREIFATKPCGSGAKRRERAAWAKMEKRWGGKIKDAAWRGMWYNAIITIEQKRLRKKDGENGKDDG